MYSNKPFKKVAKVHYASSDSGIYGSVLLTFEDGSIGSVLHPNAFRPRKIDVEVENPNV